MILPLDGCPHRLRPDVLAERRDGETYECDLRVPEELDCWPGHFPAYFIVPGFLQIDWVMRLTGRWIGAIPQLSNIERLKFKHPMFPGDHLTARIEAERERIQFRFRLANPRALFSEGRFRLKPFAGSVR